jgi:hypothetical protein
MKRIKMKTKVIFNQYWTLATMGFSEMKLGAGVLAAGGNREDGEGWRLGAAYVNTFLRIAKGNGMIRSMKRAISATRSTKTCGHGQF